MRSFIYILSVTIFIMLSGMNYFSYRSEMYAQILGAAAAFPYQFAIPDDMYNEDPAHMQHLKRAALDNGVNIVRSVSRYDENKQVSYHTDYVFLATDTKRFEAMSLKNGRILTPEDMADTAVFISTERSGSDKQMGTIASFGGNLHYSARVLDDLASSYKYAGYYKVEADSRQQFVDFVDTYILYLQAANPGFPDYASDDYISAGSGMVMRGGGTRSPLVFCACFLLGHPVFFFPALPGFADQNHVHHETEWLHKK